MSEGWPRMRESGAYACHNEDGVSAVDRVEDGMLTLLKRHQVQTLLEAGHDQFEVARIGVSVQSARRIAAEPAVEHVDDRQERSDRKIGRPSKVAPFRALVQELVGEIDEEARDTAEVGRDPAPGAPGGIPGRQDRAVRVDCRVAAACNHTDDALRGVAGGVLPARLRRGADQLPGREPRGGAVLRFTAEVVALGGSRSGAGRSRCRQPTSQNIRNPQLSISRHSSSKSALLNSVRPARGSVKDLKRPRELRDILERAREGVLMKDGRPFAIMIGVAPEGADDTLRGLRCARGSQPLSVVPSARRDREPVAGRRRGSRAVAAGGRFGGRGAAVQGVASRRWFTVPAGSGACAPRRGRCGRSAGRGPGPGRARCSAAPPAGGPGGTARRRRWSGSARCRG